MSTPLSGTTFRDSARTKTDPHIQTFYAQHRHGSILSVSGTLIESGSSIAVANTYGVFDKAVFAIAKASDFVIDKSGYYNTRKFAQPAGVESAGKAIRNLLKTTPFYREPAPIDHACLCDEHIYIDENNNPALYFVDIVTGEIENQKSTRNMAFATESGVIEEAGNICQWLIKETPLLRNIPAQCDMELLIDTLSVQKQKIGTDIPYVK